MKPDSVLDRLRQDNIVSLHRTDTGFVLREECDSYYDFHLNKEELMELAAEIVAVATGQAQVSVYDGPTR